MHRTIVDPGTRFEGGKLAGDEVAKVIRKIKDLSGLFADENARSTLDPEKPVYTVRGHFPVREGTPGNLFFATTSIEPGRVGDEYFMTRGHFHEITDRSEYYWGIEGRGMLIMMDRNGNTWAERMNPGSVHYIPAETAHRVANTGTKVLSFGACWPSDAGHDYSSIDENGFTARLIDIEGVPTLK